MPLTNSATSMADSAESPYLQLPATYLVAQTFEVSIGIDISGPGTAGHTSYDDVLVEGGPTEVDLLMIEQGDTVLYVFQVSELRGNGCVPNAACAAPARGNVAVVEVPLPKGKLAPSTYRIVAPGQAGGGQTIAADQVTLFMRSFSANPVHAQLSCQSWGSGEFRIEEATYGIDGLLTALTASLTQDCTQVRPIPSDPSVPSSAIATPKTYRVRFSWQLQLAPAS